MLILLIETCEREPSIIDLSFRHSFSCIHLVAVEKDPTGGAGTDGLISVIPYKIHLLRPEYMNQLLLTCPLGAQRQPMLAPPKISLFFLFFIF